MGTDDDKSIPDILKRLLRTSKDPKIPQDLRDKLGEGLEDLKAFLLEDEDDGHDCGCPACSGEPLPQVKQIMPAPPGLKAVYAEVDPSNPSQMAISDVVAMAIMVDPDGDTMVTGLTLRDDMFVECQCVMTFMGYIREGESPDKYAEKVRKFLEEKRKHGDDDED